MKKERVLITVKTYPTLSASYGELVCTAGVREDGSWVRLYPIPYRRLEDYSQRYKKYQWISVDVIPRKGDQRPESFAPVLESIESQGEMTTGKARDWYQRRQLILKKGDVYDDLEELIQKAHDNELSLATFKPTEILDFVVEKTEPKWDPKKLATIDALLKQPDLFEDKILLKKQFTLVRKLPYDFSYRFKDVKGKESKLMIIDWEIGMLYWNSLKDTGYDEGEAVKKVRQTYFDNFAKTKDLHLFLGTTKQFHSWGPNPFIIIGTFHPPRIDQPEFDFGDL